MPSLTAHAGDLTTLYPDVFFVPSYCGVSMMERNTSPKLFIDILKKSSKVRISVIKKLAVIFLVFFDPPCTVIHL